MERTRVFRLDEKIVAYLRHHGQGYYADIVAAFDRIPGDDSDIRATLAQLIRAGIVDPGEAARRRIYKLTEVR